MATVTFSAAGETLYAYLAGEIDTMPPRACGCSWTMHWSAAARVP